MAAIVEDCLSPREFIIPQISTDGSETPRISGALFMSGAKLYFIVGTTVTAITSA